VKAFVEEKKVNYPIVIDNVGLGEKYGLNAMPMTLLIDRNGKIAASYTGVVDRHACESKLRSLLQESAEKVLGNKVARAIGCGSKVTLQRMPL
jgi:hypothetical protein